MKSWIGILLFAAAAIAGGVVFYTSLHNVEPSAPEAIMRSNSGQEPTLAARVAPGFEVTDKSSIEDAGSFSYASEFKKSADFLQFIQLAVEEAKRGDGDAAYYLAEALTFCDDAYRVFFRKRGKELSLKEALDEWSRLPGIDMREPIQRAYGRCHGLYETEDQEWGEPAEWIAAATDAGQPLAQLRTATDAMLNISRRGNPTPPRLGVKSQTLTSDDALSLARAAVESMDPDVLFRISDILGLLRPDIPTHEAMQRTLVWKYAACLRGADCDADADWLYQACQVDPQCRRDGGGLNYLLSNAMTLSLNDLEFKAQELNRTLDEQPEMAWRELGLDKPPE